MMNIDKTYLKVFAGALVSESDDLTTPSKIQLLNFLREADDIEVKNLLLDGTITYLDEMSHEIVEDRFYTSDIGRFLQKEYYELMEFFSYMDTWTLQETNNFFSDILTEEPNLINKATAYMPKKKIPGPSVGTPPPGSEVAKTAMIKAGKIKRDLAAAKTKLADLKSITVGDVSDKVKDSTAKAIKDVQSKIDSLKKLDSETLKNKAKSYISGDAKAEKIRKANDAKFKLAKTKMDLAREKMRHAATKANSQAGERIMRAKQMSLKKLQRAQELADRASKVASQPGATEAQKVAAKHAKETVEFVKQYNAVRVDKAIAQNVLADPASTAAQKTAAHATITKVDNLEKALQAKIKTKAAFLPGKLPAKAGDLSIKKPSIPGSETPLAKQIPKGDIEAGRKAGIQATKTKAGISKQLDTINKEKSAKSLSGKIEKAKGEISSKYKDVSTKAKNTLTWASKHKGEIGATVLAAAAITAGVMIYRRYFSKAAVACKNAPNKGECFQLYKNNALKAEIASLKEAMKRCNSSTNPRKCIRQLEIKISKLKAKIK